MSRRPSARGSRTTSASTLEPEKVDYNLHTDPPGLQLAYEDEGIALSSPAIIRPIVGSVQTVTVEPIQQHLSFDRWSDGSTNRSRTFTVGATPQTFTAIYENKAPNAVITPAAPAGQAPLTVTFNGSGSSDPEGDALTYSWSSSAGHTATGANPQWTFATPGDHTVTLTVTDQIGRTGTATVTVHATVDQLPPNASFTATPPSGRAPLTVALDGRASSDPEGGTLTYAWSSSTGQTTTGAQSSLTFSQVGTHTVTLTVTDSAGASGSSSKTVTVEPPAPAGLVAAYGFDETSGSSVVNAAGSGNTGTVAGATRSTSGRYGGALSFDGTNDSVSVPDAASLDLTNNMTLSAYVRPTAATGWRTVLMKERPGGLSYGMYGSGDLPRPSGQLVIGSAEQALMSPSALPANTWSHLAFTYNGSVMRLYVNGVEVADQTQTGSAVVSTGALKIGGNAIWGEWFAGLIDEVRVYNRALTATELQSDMNAPITAGTPDVQAPTVPAGLTATPEIGRVTLAWTASTDNVGVTGYEVHRSTTPGFTPTGATLLTTVTALGHVDAAVTAGTAYHYRVIAKDAAGNASGPSSQASATPTTDATAPTVSVTTPAAGATVSGAAVGLTANAADNVGVVGVQFKVDGTNVGAEDTSAPYGISWNSTSVGNGGHSVTAVARDAAGNTTTSAPAAITVDNAAPDTQAPTVAVTAPAAGATVSGSVPLAANAADNVAVVGVQFKVDGTNVGAEDTTGPYEGSWNSATVANGNHTLTAVARDAAGNATTSAPVSVTVSNAAPPAGLVAAYGFDEASGNSVVNAAGSGNTGTVAGATRSPSGRYGGALSFDGTNDSVSVPDAANLDLTNNMTLSAYVRPTGATGWRTVLMKERPGGLSYGMYASGDLPRPSGQLVIGSAEQALMSPSPLPANTWSHLAFTYNGSVMRLYVNGVEVADQTQTGSAVVSTGALKIGGNAIWGEWFAGLIDEVRVYNRALTATELLTSMNTPITPTAPDTTAPTVSVTAPAAGATVSGAAVSLTANAADNVGVVGVQFKVDGTNVGTEDTTSPYAVSWNSTSVANGSHNITAVARDAAGNITTSTAVAVTVTNTAPDTTAPTVSVTAPAAGATVSGAAVSLTANAADNVGVVGVQFKVDGTNVGTEDTTSPYAVSWNSTSVANGSHNITAVAHDAAGNITTSTAVAVTVTNTAPDTTAPTVSVTAPAAGATVSGAAVSLTANAADNVGVVGVQFKVDGTNVGTEDTTSPYAVSWNSTSVTNGSHNITAVARDAAGNITTSTAVAVTVTNTAPDTTAPTVSVTAPAAGATVSGAAVSLTANAADNVGVVGVQFKVDGTNVGTEDTTSPYAASWNSTSVTNGSHNITAVARDAAGNITTSTAVAVTVTNTAPPAGLVAAFGFDEASGNSVTDASGVGNNGTVSGATRAAVGRYGGALSFDGTNDSVAVPDAASLDLTNNMTLSAYVNPTSSTGWRTVLMKERPGGLVYGLYGSSDLPRPSGQLVIGSAEQQLLGPATLPTNAWSHVAFTYDGSTMRLYVNGIEVADQAQTGSAVVSTGALKIGGNPIWGEWFAGMIDEVRIYNRALTPAQLQADMSSAVNPAGLAAQATSAPLDVQDSRVAPAPASEQADDITVAPSAHGPFAPAPPETTSDGVVEQPPATDHDSSSVETEETIAEIPDDS